jgi:hypothetical protein
MEFCEELPPQCPPPEAEDIAIEEAWRVVSGAELTAEDFYSHARKQIPKRPTATDCDHASCSLFTSRDKVAALASRLPKTRIANPWIARVAIPVGAGLSVANKKTLHVHLWMYKSFDPLVVAQAPELP